MSDDRDPKLEGLRGEPSRYSKATSAKIARKPPKSGDFGYLALSY